MIKTQTGKVCLSFSLILVLLITLSTGLAAQEPTSGPASVQQTPTRIRPTVGPSQDEDQISSRSDSSDAVAPVDTCAAVQGTAIHWGVGELHDVGVTLGNGGWQAEAITSQDGRYQFAGLGMGTGILQVNAGLTGLTPMINNAAIRLNCNFVTQANIGLYGGDERPTPPGQIIMRASPQTVSPGDVINMHLTISNSLPNPMSQVVVTDLFPEGLIVERVNTSAGMVEVLDRRMMTVIVENVPQDGQVQMAITARVGNNVAQGSQIRNTATLFYAEGAADQASHTLTVGRTVAQAAASQAAQVDTTGANQGSAISPETSQSQPETKAATTTEADLEPPAPTVLPVTGFKLTYTLPLAVLAVIGLLIKGVQSIKRR